MRQEDGCWSPFTGIMGLMSENISKPIKYKMYNSYNFLRELYRVKDGPFVICWLDSLYVIKMTKSF